MESERCAHVQRSETTHMSTYTSTYMSTHLPRGGPLYSRTVRTDGGARRSGVGYRSDGETVCAVEEGAAIFWIRFKGNEVRRYNRRHAQGGSLSCTSRLIAQHRYPTHSNFFHMCHATMCTQLCALSESWVRVGYELGMSWVRVESCWVELG